MTDPLPLISDAEVLAKIETFLDRHKMKPTAFGRSAVGDGNLIANLKAGRSLTLKTAQRVLGYMATYRPDQPVEQAAA